MGIGVKYRACTRACVHLGVDQGLGFKKVSMPIWTVSRTRFQVWGLDLGVWDLGQVGFTATLDYVTNYVDA